MRQTVLTVIVPIAPESAGAASDLARGLQGAADARFAGVTALHFMSITVYDDAHFDPILIIEANFDGEPRHFWPELVAVIGPELLALVRMQKPGERYDVVPSVVAELPAYLERNSVMPGAFHRGNRGLSCARIKAEGALFAQAEAATSANAATYAKMSAEAIRQDLRGRLAPIPPADPERRPLGDRIGDAAPFWLFIAAVGFVITAPLLHGLVAGDWSWLGWQCLWLWLPLVIIVVRLRHAENTDPTQDKPPLDTALIARMRTRENDPRYIQNHLCSIVLVKPGIIRSAIIRAALVVLNLQVQANSTDGYLSQMRTIHFAHWSLVGNGSRLLFLSNFDGSWQSYLDDFVEKAASGLTLAWSNCIGFPPTRWLFLDGATHGREFKAWARNSQRETLMWYTAYPRFTVNQIEKQAAFADGLRRDTMTDGEARAWAQLL